MTKQHSSLTTRSPTAAAALWLLLPALTFAKPAYAQPEIVVDASVARGPVRNFWGGIGTDYIYQFGTGTSHQKLWEWVGELNATRRHRVFTTWRCHNILSDQLDVAATYVYDPAGPQSYDYTRIDEIYDTFDAAGMDAIVELGLMPADLAENPSWLGDWGAAVISPPHDYDEWRTLVAAVTQHLRERYPQQSKRWWWEIWNEPNLGQFWDTSNEEEGLELYFKLYDYAADGVKSVDPLARVGGAATAGCYWQPSWFIAHTAHESFDGHWVPWYSDYPHEPTLNYATGGEGSPVDFFSHHWYGHEIQGAIGSVYSHREEIRRLHPDSPDSRALLLDENAPVHWCEYWASTRYTAIWRIAQVDAFYELSDHFDDPAYLPETIVFVGSVMDDFQNRTVATQVGDDLSWVVKLPLFNAYDMLSMLGTERVEVSGVEFDDEWLVPAKGTGHELLVDEVNALATREPGRSVQVLVYHLDETNQLASETDGTYLNGDPTPTFDAHVTVNNIPFSQARVSWYVIDREHSNAYGHWQDQLDGSWPGGFDQATYEELDAIDDLQQTMETEVTIAGGTYETDLVLQEQSAILIDIVNLDPPDGFETMRINCGGRGGVDSGGHVWQAGQAFADGSWGYEGGVPYIRNGSGAGESDPFLLESERYGEHGYRFALPNGYYEVALRFFENDDAVTASGQRVFDVLIEEAVVLDGFDIYAEAGFAAALERDFEVQVADGVLDIAFENVMGQATISAIAVRATDPSDPPDGGPDGGVDGGAGTGGAPALETGDDDGCSCQLPGPYHPPWRPALAAVLVATLLVLRGKRRPR